MSLDAENQQAFVTDLVQDVLPGSNRVKPLAHGGESVAYEAKKDGKGYIIRVQSPENSKYDIEHAVYKRLHDLGVKVPNPVKASVSGEYPFAYSIYEKIDGEPMLEVDKGSYPTVLRSVGEELTKMDKFQISGFGRIDARKYREDGILEGENDNWLDFMKRATGDKIDKLVEKVKYEQTHGFDKSDLNSDQIKQLIELANRADEIKARQTSIKQHDSGVLLHGDLYGGNIIVKSGRLEGLIDSKFIVGPRIYDVAYYSVMDSDPERYKYVNKAIGVDTDTEEFHALRVLIAGAKLYTRHVANDYLGRYPDPLMILQEELDK